MDKELKLCPFCSSKPIKNETSGVKTGHAVCVNRDCALFNIKIEYNNWNKRFEIEKGYISVHSLRVDWFSSECGDEFTEYVVGKKNVISIISGSDYAVPYYRVWFKDGSVIQHYNINRVGFKPQ